MTAAESTEKILTVLAEIAETDEVRTNPDLALYDLQVLDSMKTVQLIVALGQEMGVEVSPAVFERVSSSPYVSTRWSQMCAGLSGDW